MLDTLRELVCVCVCALSVSLKSCFALQLSVCACVCAKMCVHQVAVGDRLIIDLT